MFLFGCFFLKFSKLVFLFGCFFGCFYFGCFFIFVGCFFWVFFWVFFGCFFQKIKKTPSWLPLPQTRILLMGFSSHFYSFSWFFVLSPHVSATKMQDFPQFWLLIWHIYWHFLPLKKRRVHDLYKEFDIFSLWIISIYWTVIEQNLYMFA